MRGAEHYRMAEDLLALAEETAQEIARINDQDGDPSYANDALTAMTAAAQVHATLALAAAQVTTACASVGSIGVLADWVGVAS